jgi:hypothetical protein
MIGGDENGQHFFTHLSLSIAGRRSLYEILPATANETE